MKLGSLLRRFGAVTLLLLAAACGKDPDFDIDTDPGIHAQESGGRQENQETRRVLLFYEAGFNSLTDALDDDMNKELVQGYSEADRIAGLPKAYIPKGGRSSDVLLVYTKLARGMAYKPVKSYLKRLYLDGQGALVTDTLQVFEETMAAASEEGLRRVTSYVKEHFPAKGYGMVFSSHGSGWLPPRYYYSPSDYEESHQAPSSVSARRKPDIPTESLADDPFAGMVRSIGMDELSEGEGALEMTVDEFARGIAMHLDYLFFDMCLSGGVELFYRFKDIADYVGGSPAEVLADGTFDYSRITEYLLKPEQYDLEGLFRDSFLRYYQQSGQGQSSTVTLVRSDAMEGLAEVCATLAAKYRTALAGLNYRRVQGYYRLSRHYFFDLEDIFVQCGAAEEDLAQLRRAIERCIVYRNATPYFLNFKINTYSGMSMYLPCAGTPLLDAAYRNEAWNKAIHLVE